MKVAQKQQHLSAVKRANRKTSAFDVGWFKKITSSLN